VKRVQGLVNRLYVRSLRGSGDIGKLVRAPPPPRDATVCGWSPRARRGDRGARGGVASGRARRRSLPRRGVPDCVRGDEGAADRLLA